MGPFSLSDPITEQMVVLVTFVIFSALRPAHQHKQDIYTAIVIGLELLILSCWQSFVTAEKQWQDCRRICNPRDYLEPEVRLLLLVLYILTK